MCTCVDLFIYFCYFPQEYAADRIDNYFATKKTLLEQLKLGENEVPTKIGIKRAENEIPSSPRVKRHLSGLDTANIERWNIESNQ